MTRLLQGGLGCFELLCAQRQWQLGGLTVMGKEMEQASPEGCVATETPANSLTGLRQCCAILALHWPRSQWRCRLSEGAGVISCSG